MYCFEVQAESRNTMKMRRHTFQYIASSVVSMATLVLSGCHTICIADYASPQKYPTDTPENLVDSYLRAFNQPHDEAVYYFRTPLAEQNSADREAFVRDGAETCRWVAESWDLEGVEYLDKGARAIVTVSAVVASESERTNDTLRFECLREGERWRVLKHEWVEESVPVEREFD
jgi:hypothetical protein